MDVPLPKGRMNRSNFGKGNMRWLKITKLGKNNADPGAELLVGTAVTELSRHHWNRSNTGVQAVLGLVLLNSVELRSAEDGRNSGSSGRKDAGM